MGDTSCIRVSWHYPQRIINATFGELILARFLIEGVPTLAVEILSPNDTIEEIHEKITVYQSAGVPLIWVLNPYDRTVTVYRPGTEPDAFNIHQELSGESHLPGFRVPVARLFE